MNSDPKSIIESFESIVLCDVSLEGDVFQNPLNYLVSDFGIVSLPHFLTLNAVLNAINPHAEVSIGIGFEAYKKSIIKGIKYCKTPGKEYSFLLPLWDEYSTYNFVAKVIAAGDRLNILFFYYDRSGSASMMDSILASNFKDQLTGLFNRQTMKEHVAANRRDGYLCLFDLNKFKVINDTFGHEIGDEVLVNVAKYLISISSEDEVFYRRSGDEFMILFFKHDLRYVQELISRIEVYLRQLHTKDMKHCPSLRASAAFGVVELLYPDGEEIIDSEILLKLTDLAMYQAKTAKKISNLITYKEAKDIIAAGNLNERLRTLAASISR